MAKLDLFILESKSSPDQPKRKTCSGFMKGSGRSAEGFHHRSLFYVRGNMTFKKTDQTQHLLREEITELEDQIRLRRFQKPDVKLFIVKKTNKL